MTTSGDRLGFEALNAALKAAGEETRLRVLALLSEAELTVSDLTDILRQSQPRISRHLKLLAEAGLVARTTEDREQPGRPRALYAADPDSARAGRRSYRLLAEILTNYVAGQSPQPTQVALAAGTEWGRALAANSGRTRRVSAAGATQRMLDALSDIGFVPEAVKVGREQRVLLHHCPFREAAEEHRDVVCGVHLGLMRGLLDELDAPIEAEQLEPFVGPSLCVAHLARRAK